MTEGESFEQVLDRVVSSRGAAGALVYEITDEPRLDPTLWRFAVLLAAACRAAERPFAVTCTSKSARGYFRVTELDTLLTVRDKVDEALDAVRAGD